VEEEKRTTKEKTANAESLGRDGGKLKRFQADRTGNMSMLRKRKNAEVKGSLREEKRFR